MRQAKALIRLCICVGWSEPLLVAHTTLLVISCHGSNNISKYVHRLSIMDFNTKCCITPISASTPLDNEIKILHSMSIYLVSISHIWASTRENQSSVVWEQQRRRPACASAQSDQRLCYSLFGKFICELATDEISIF